MSPSRPQQNRATIERYWTLAQSQDWEGVAGLLSEDVVYEIPQTSERVTGREAYLRFNQQFTSDWEMVLTRLVADDENAASWGSFLVEGTPLDGVTFFGFDDSGLVRTIHDIWPEPFDPPPGRAALVDPD